MPQANAQTGSRSGSRNRLTSNSARRGPRLSTGDLLRRSFRLPISATVPRNQPAATAPDTDPKHAKYRHQQRQAPETARWLQWIREGCYLHVMRLQAAVQKGIYWIDDVQIGRAILQEHLAARSHRWPLGKIQGAE
jgi:hypothetical protein